MRGSGKPRPFKNPRVEISTEAYGAQKEWQNLSQRSVEVGDIIQGKGLVVALGDVYRTVDPVQYFFTFEMKNGTEHREQGHPDWDSYRADSEILFQPTVRVFSRIRG